MGFMEHMSEGILTTMIGMGVVFIVLITLSFCIQALNYFVDHILDKKKKKKEGLGEELSLIAEQVVPNIKMCQLMDTTLPVIAAIVTASICAASGKSSKDFSIKEIRAVGK